MPESGGNDQHSSRPESLPPDAPVELNDTAMLTAAVSGGGEAVAGTAIGPYHLLQRIGEGGMGEVWLADQKQPVQRRVAVKLIKIGLETREVVARFAFERQTLALMEHPAIAKVFDAGSTPNGRPYFVMEYVSGIPITDYCDKRKLNTRERLKLFVQACDGVQHAHQKAVIHRDLKPSNILVSEVDNKPVPRIIDFGVAKATAQQFNAETLFTRIGSVIGTPGYMSPEQADSGGLDVDTRTDVYSLGIILYELLVGALPLELSNLSFHETLRRIREQDAPRPSTKVRTLGPRSTATAQNRSSDPPALARQLRGDLDAIALKAIEKDRTRRYATPAELAADIRRYLRNEPVLARPAGLAYRIRKYVRRNAALVAAAAVALVLLIAFAVIQSIELRRITRERDRADRIAGFMMNMFHVSDPSEARGNTVTAREILDKASHEINSGLARDPELQAHLMYDMAVTYEALGLHSESEPLLQKAVAIQTRLFGPDNPDTLQSRCELGWALAGQGHYAEAVKMLDGVLSVARTKFGPGSPVAMIAMIHLGWIYNTEGRYPEGEQVLREAVAQRRNNPAAATPETLPALSTLATVLASQGKFSEAERLYREALDGQRRTLGPDSARTLYTMSNLADTLDSAGRYPEAEQLFRETLAAQRRILGPEHPSTLETMTHLSDTLAIEHRYAEAEQLAREALAIQERVRGREHPGTLSALQHFGALLSREGRFPQAEPLFRDAIDRASHAKEVGTLAAAWYDFACAAAVAGHREQALEYLRQSIDHGLKNAGFMATDNDLASLRGDPRFSALVKLAEDTGDRPNP